MTGVLRTALIGCGRIGAHTPEWLREAAPPGWIPISHAEAIASTNGLQLTAVCDTDVAMANQTAATLGVTAFTDYRQMIDCVKPHIISIATRTEGRCDIVEFASHAGVRGLHIEKPLGRSLRECRRAMQAAEAASVALTYGTTRRWMDVFTSAHAMVRSGAIGPLEHITVEFGRASLLWTHPHSFDLVVWFAGGRWPEMVQASCSFPANARNGGLVDADPMIEGALITFSGQLTAMISPAAGYTVRLAGTTGALTVSADGRRLLRQQRARKDWPYLTDPEPVAVAPQFSGTQRAFQALRDAVVDGRVTGITASEILLSNHLGFACLLSGIQQGRRVRLDEVPDDFTVTGRQGNKYA